MNLVVEWIKQAKKKNGTLQASVNELNEECGTSIPLRSIYPMRSGHRNVPLSIHEKMLKDILSIELQKQTDMPSYKRKKLIAKLLLPVRVK